MGYLIYNVTWEPLTHLEHAWDVIDKFKESASEVLKISVEELGCDSELHNRHSTTPILEEEVM